jgi:hypothetical protein
MNPPLSIYDYRIFFIFLYIIMDIVGMYDISVLDIDGIYDSSVT